MIFEIGDGEAGKIGYFWKGGGLFSCLIDGVMFSKPVCPGIQMKVIWEPIE